MSLSKQQDENQSDNAKNQPFVAPCNQIQTDAPLRWLRRGLSDYRHAIGHSMAYGSIMTLSSMIIAYWAYSVGSIVLAIMMLSGFIFVGPALAIGLYSISCQLDRGLKPELLFCLRQGGKRFGNQMLFAFVLLIVFLLWARSASVMHIFFPSESDANMTDFIMFFGIGSLVGSLFALIVFCASAFALPMIMDRDVDAVTAMITSFNAVLKNKHAMVVWSSIIVAAIGIGFVTLFIGFIFTLPVIGYATWHGYRDVIISDEWPQDPDIANLNNT